MEDDKTRPDLDKLSKLTTPLRLSLCSFWSGCCGDSIGSSQPQINPKNTYKPTMQKYIGTKVINATPMTRGAYNRLRVWAVTADENPEDEGYLVEYTDGGKPNHQDFSGYISWSPKDVFERAYRICDGMSFGMAIEAMKQGKKVSRKGWNGKGMYIWLMPATAVKSEWCHEPHLKELADLNGGEIEALGTIRMYTVNASGRRAVLTGWLASQTDMFADDWRIVD